MAGAPGGKPDPSTLASGGSTPPGSSAGPGSAGVEKAAIRAGQKAADSRLGRKAAERGKTGAGKGVEKAADTRMGRRATEMASGASGSATTARNPVAGKIAKAATPDPNKKPGTVGKIAEKGAEAGLKSFGVPSPIAKRMSGPVAQMALKLNWPIIGTGVATVAVLVAVSMLLMSVLSGGGVSIPGIEPAKQAGVPADIVGAAYESQAVFGVPWEITAAIAQVQTGAGNSVPGDPSTSRVSYPQVNPPITVKRGTGTYTGVYLLDTAAGDGDLDGNNTRTATRFIAAQLAAAKDDAPATTTADTTAVTTDDAPADWDPWAHPEFWQSAISALPIAASAYVPLPPTVAVDYSCANDPATFVFGDLLADLALNAEGKQPGVTTSLRPQMTLAEVLTEMVRVSHSIKWTSNPDTRKVIVVAGTFGWGALPTSETVLADGTVLPAPASNAELLDQIVTVAGGPGRIVFIQPRDPGQAAYPPAAMPQLETDPVPGVVTELQALSTRTPGVAVIDATGWEQAIVGSTENGDPADLYDPTLISPDPSVRSAWTDWFLSQACPQVTHEVPADTPTTVDQSTFLAQQVWQLAKAWHEGADLCAAKPGTSLPLTGATSAYLDPATLTNVLATIGKLESGDDYTNSVHAVSKVGRNGGGNPTGRYQWLYDSWANYGGFEEAYLAPPAVQDAYTVTNIDQYLIALGDNGAPADISWIPTAHYAGITGARELKSGVRLWSTVPNPRHNRLSYGEYRDLWMKTYSEIAAGGTAAPSPGAGIDTGVSILGPATITVDQMIAAYAASGHDQGNLTVPIDEFIRIVYDEAGAEGVRPDFMLAQMIGETGWFSNSDTKINNYAGIAHYDNVSSGKRFASPTLGVRAQAQMLHEIVVGRDNVTYARPWAGAHWGVDRRTDVWNRLGGLPEGVGWASAHGYWELILGVYAPLATAAGVAVPTGQTGTGATSGLCVGGLAAAGAHPLVGPYCTGINGAKVTFNGKQSGSIGPSDLVTTPNVGSGMQPAAAAAWDQLVAEAVAAGFPASDFHGSGWGPRPKTPSSAHPVGLAIDINADWITTPGTYTIPEGGDPIPNVFKTPQFKWLFENSWRFGFCSVVFQRPITFGGQLESGGHYADGSPAPFESWHWEYAAGVTGEQTFKVKPGDTINGPHGGPGS